MASMPFRCTSRAFGPLSPGVISKSTASPASSVRKPSIAISEWCTNTSSSPSRWMTHTLFHPRTTSRSPSHAACRLPPASVWPAAHMPWATARSPWFEDTKKAESERLRVRLDDRKSPPHTCLIRHPWIATYPPRRRPSSGASLLAGGPRLRVAPDRRRLRSRLRDSFGSAHIAEFASLISCGI